MREIKLTQGLFAKVDDEDYERLNQYKWHAAKGKYHTYASRYIGKGATGSSKSVPMHREILGITDSKVFGDHINHDGLDNRRSKSKNSYKCSKPSK